MTRSLTYRAEIDGLRAVAVVPVVLFHAGVPNLEGGYVGVDVFFVISGFLITSMIAAEARAREFSIARFYERRIRRIFPAYLAMTVVAGVLGWLLMAPSDFAKFGQSVVAASGFCSNILFWLQDGYFDAPAHLKPMLHTWSLSVEEQFYIGFPLLLTALFRWVRGQVSLVLVSCLVGSLAACIWMTGRNPSLVFYQAPLRAWELLLGAVLALGIVPASRRMARELIALLGLAGIAGAVIGFSAGTPFPGYHALAPSIGAACVIYSGGDTAVGRGLAWAPIRSIGMLSYSLYLWHWPLLVFATYYVGGPPPPTMLAVVLVSTLAVAALSWRFVEQPFRRRLLPSRRRLFAVTAVATMVVIAAATYVWRSGGVPSRMRAEVLALDAARKDFNKDRPRCHAQDERPIPFEDKCVYGKQGVAPSVAIWGDSFAPELAYVLGKQSEARGDSLLYISYSNCPPSLNLFGAARPVCDRHNRELLSRLVATPTIQTVILVARYEMFYRAQGLRYLWKLSQVVHELAAAHKHVLLIHPIPRPPAHVPMLLARQADRGWPLADAFIDRATDEEENQEITAFLVWLEQLPGVRGVWPRDALCDATRCRLSVYGKPLYYDEVHLSLTGAAQVVPLLDVFPSR